VVATALPLHVLLLLPCGGVNARAAAAQKGTWADWARKLEKENGLSGPLNVNHLTFYFFISIFRNPLLHKSTKRLGALSNAQARLNSRWRVNARLPPSA
jgi:hypothetical protein